MSAYTVYNRRTGPRSLSPSPSLTSSYVEAYRQVEFDGFDSGHDFYGTLWMLPRAGSTTATVRGYSKKDESLALCLCRCRCLYLYLSFSLRLVDVRKSGLGLSVSLRLFGALLLSVFTLSRFHA